MSTPATDKTRGQTSSATSPKGRSERLGLRVPAELKDRIERAAAYRGVSVTDFLLATASEEATRTIEQHTRYELDAEASRRFAQTLTGPGRAREELVELFRE